MSRDLVVVSDQHKRRAVLALELAKNLHHMGGILAIEVSCRLIREQDGRPIGEAPGNRRSLPLPSRELDRKMIDAVRKTNRFQQLRRAGGAGRRRKTLAKHGDLHIFCYSEGGQQVERLEDKANLATTIPGGI